MFSAAAGIIGFMNAEENSSQQQSARDAIVALLRRNGGQARFVADLNAALASSRIGQEESAHALAALERDGAVIVREHFCADPHLADADLRVAALVESTGGGDPQLSAIRRIDEAWNKWLTEYLANHRCG